MPEQVAANFVTWFLSQNGTLDTEKVGIVDFPGHGRGAVALQDIPEDHTLFTIPRDLTLSMRTSSLPNLMGKSWKEHGLHEGWAGLILCMMWEESKGPESKWSGYLDVLPNKFDTPMFWGEEDVQELQGTAVVDKIGRDEAERDYHDKVAPAIKGRPDLFPEDKIDAHFSLERYHIMGSRILSRSFHVEQWKGEHSEEQDEDEPGNSSAMDIDLQEGEAPAPEGDAEAQEPEEAAEDIQVEDEDDEDDEDREDPADVAMVPMADMLNARFESENAKLFYEERVLRMVSTKLIKAGEQIWNTYGDPPNSDLLRRYGHVDLVPLRPPLSGMGNPGDVVEVRADLVVSVATSKVKYDLQERVDWWLEEADDDVFVLHTDCELPEEFISFTRLLLLPKDEWEKTAKKSKLPKPKLDKDVLAIAVDVLQKRLRDYPTTMEEDEQLLAPGAAEQLSLNKRHAVVVRLGEKRILHGTLQDARAKLAASAGSSKKRGREEDKGGKGKKIRK
ncbi:SET domain-containing protein [Cubamyces sp. BRFM 1775]|nr:SET domain-containing protein [Cubamyces sp. BRFM 1775]